MLNKKSIPQKDLIKILKGYSLGEIQKIEPIKTSGNLSFLVRADSGDYFLRICPEGQRWRSKEEIASELELIDHLNKNNFSAPKLIAKINEDFIIEYEGKFGYLRKYDSSDAILNPNIAEVEEFGRTLGWLHSLLEGYQTKNKRNHFFDLETTKKNFLEDKPIILKSDLPDKENFINNFEKELFSLSFPDNLPKGMIHEDLGKRHILWKDGKISCIIDFDRTYYGKLIIDLGQAIRGWCIIDDSLWSNENFEALLKGYLEKRKLTDLEKQYLFDAVKFGILERGLSFCLNYVYASQSDEAAEYAHKSASNNEKDGLIGMLNKNKAKFLKILEKKSGR